MNVFYQYSFFPAVRCGLYGGAILYSEVGQNGDFGIGTFDQLDGELFLNNGIFTQCRASGDCVQVNPEDYSTPFTAVTRFHPESTHVLRQSRVYAELGRLVFPLSSGTFRNCILAIRLSGDFKRVSTRTYCRQRKPFRRLSAVDELHTRANITNVMGVMVGFYIPEHLSCLGGPGFHLHFLSEDGRLGGHVDDFKIKSGATLETSTMRRIVIDSPTHTDFNKADLSQPTSLQKPLVEVTSTETRSN